MSRMSLSKTSLRSSMSNPRIRKISRTESECSCEEAQRLTDGVGAGDGASAGGGGGDDEDVLSYCDYHDFPPPPDGGYGWVIVFASFICNMIVDGIAYTFGVFLNEFVVYYGEGKGQVAWVGSLLSGMYLSAGPVVSALTNKFGCRAVCMAGSVISTVAFVLSIFSPTVNMLMLTYGVMGGIGFGLIYLPAVVCVGYYFETKRSLATGIAVCGSGFGTFAFAPLATYLLEEYGWKGSNLILAGLILNCAICGALMRPLEYPKVPSVKPLLQRMAEEKRFQMERGSIGGSYFMVQLPDGSMEKRMKMPINIDPGVHSSFNLDQLVPGTPLTPIPTVPTLPTISEVKVQEQSGSSSGNSVNDSQNKQRRPNPRIAELQRNEGKMETSASDKDLESKNNETEFTQVQRGNLPRNVSSPAFTSHHQGLPKNGSVPFFDRMRKTSVGERYRPTLGAIQSKSRGNVNGDVRKSLHLRLSTSSFTGSKNNNADDMDNDNMSFTASRSSIPRPMMVRPLSRKDIFYSGSVVHLPEYQSQKSLTNYRQSQLSIGPRGSARGDGDVEKAEQYDLCPCFVLPESFKSALAAMMDFSLLKDPVFMFIAVSNIFGMAGLYVPFVYLVDAAIQSGIEPNSASFLISIIGITNTVGRIACGYFADFPWVNSLLLNNICLVISTVAVSATPFCQSYVSYIIMSIFFGIAVSGYISLTSIILVDLLGLDKLTNAFGLLILFRGAAAIVGSPLAGAVYDATKSYDIPFFMAGFLFFLSAVSSFLAPCMKRFVKKGEPPVTLDALTPIDEDEEEEDGPITIGRQIPEIDVTAASPMNPNSAHEIKQIESVL
ncbi:uncharacterized protein LOC123301696 isoform X2 [Chrysoperla carnea]|uniref:uncharacterized protein LOC123301696 isoform X2 n=1 Tax=Chrysoperla carnea TaxID=189513 RepID=UPI001D079EEF|nr:uncharacterized protein LOC123301696 isoform X2 [Chrysoperla carnea]